MLKSKTDTELEEIMLRKIDNLAEIKRMYYFNSVTAPNIIRSKNPTSWSQHGIIVTLVFISVIFLDLL